MICWLRLDLRLADNPALLAATESGAPVIPVFTWSPDDEAPWAPGGASRWWLHQSLTALDASLRDRGSRLIVRQGSAVRELLSVARAVGATHVVWAQRYEPIVIAGDAKIEAALVKAGLGVVRTPGNLLFEPDDVRTQAGQPFQVFTPFWKACQALPAVAPAHPAPRTIRAPAQWPRSAAIADLALEPTVDWTGGLASTWKPGEAGARAALKTFMRGAMGEYREGRDHPAQQGTSGLSPHLRFGEISPRQVWHAVREAMYGAAGAKKLKHGAETSAQEFLRQVGWREFAHHLLHHFPDTPERPLRETFAKFPWRRDAKALRAWQRGVTGYPIVDAGMRELWHTGWMHNRVRMVAGSFLVKHLLIPWQEGAEWFWDTLVDADLANNTLGWQWIAGCGADAAPYFRIFNPVLQGEKFDADGAYVRRWVPELSRLPNHLIHKPWTATPIELAAASVSLGETYPNPIVDHDAARERALAAYATLKA